MPVSKAKQIVVEESKSSDSAREQGREPTSEEREPPIFENGLNTGANLQDSLDVEELDLDLYKSVSLWTPARARGVFGGAILSQSIAASNSTVKETVRLHSLHAYFLLPGNKDIPVFYHVVRIRDGGSYVTRLVKAVQRGKTIYTILLSYQVPEPSQPKFAIPLPMKDGPKSSQFSGSVTANTIIANLSEPEDSPLNEERYLKVLREKGDKLDEKVKKILRGWVSDRQNSAVEIRDALPGMYDDNGLPTPGYEQAFWMKTRNKFEGDSEAQKAALAYASDFYLLSTVPKALGNSRHIKMMASLDHSMWFYDDALDISSWVLFVMQTQASGHGRGVCMGRIYRRDGTLIAVVAQEGLVRGKEAAGPAKL